MKNSFKKGVPQFGAVFSLLRSFDDITNNYQQPIENNSR